MTSQPETVGTPMIRTDFSDPAGWETLRTAVETPNEDDFLAHVHLVDDQAYRDMTAEQLLPLIGPHSLFIVADRRAISRFGQPLLCIYRDGRRTEQLRVIARELWSIENNISLGNMDWDEFTRAADEDGVFRGF